MQRDEYTSTTKFLHWTIAILIIIEYAIGMFLLFNKGYKQVNFIHKQIGLTILVLVICRIFWRIFGYYPPPLKELSPCEKITARIMHLLLYTLMLFVLFSGIIRIQAHGYSIEFWNMIKVPTLIDLQPQAIGKILKKVHEYAAHVFISLICLHIIIAFWHHYIRTDRVLLRMLPFQKKNIQGQA